MAIQEAKIPKESITDTEQAARNKGWSTAINLCIITTAEGKSAGTAVGSRTQIGSKNSFADEGGDLQLQARFQMKHFGAVCKGGIHFGSCYLHCNWDANRKFNLDLLEAIGARIGTLRGPWIIGGDWQCPPDDLRETGWLKTVKGTIYAPTAPTCGDRALDYFVVSEGLAQAGAIVAACTVGDAGFKPHSPSRLIVKADARAVMVRQLKVPVGFGASLPYGPANRQSSPLALRDPTAEVDEGNCSDARTIDDLAADYEGLIGTIEKELCSVAGLDGLQAEARSGRAGGAKFCWKPAMGDDTEGATKTTSASRAWRRTSKRLADVNHTKVAKNAEAAR